jgi:hypothetical protein
MQEAADMGLPGPYVEIEIVLPTRWTMAAQALLPQLG